MGGRVFIYWRPTQNTPMYAAITAGRWVDRGDRDVLGMDFRSCINDMFDLDGQVTGNIKAFTATLHGPMMYLVYQM